MGIGTFPHHELRTVGEALDIAEDVTGDYFQFTTEQWRRHRYQVKTLRSLRGREIATQAFALLGRTLSRADSFAVKPAGEGYVICLQDHWILRACARDRALELLPLLIYVFTHELVHIVRFCSHLQRYELSDCAREAEERVVHATTFDILARLALPHLDHVLTAYRSFRHVDEVFGINQV